MKFVRSPTDGLARRVRAHLRKNAARSEPITYKALADALELSPPNTIHQVTEALEQLMKEDVANENPLIAALVISRMRHGLPASGFFDVAQQLGCFDNAPPGLEDAAFHEAAFAAAVTFWGSTEIVETGDVA
jgi:hypothetical protein